MARRPPSSLTPRRKPKTEGAVLPPSREDILAFIASSKGKVGKREISRHFNLNQPGKILLKRVLKDLESDGSIERDRRTLHHAGALPPVIVADVIERDSLGDFICIPAEWNETRGEVPKILLHPPRKGARDAGPAPGINDRVLIRIEETGDENGPAYAGKLIKLLSHQAKRAVGVFRAHPSGGGRMIPIDRKARGEEIAIAPDATFDAQDGDLIAVELGRNARLGTKSGRVRERLGSTKSERAISMIAIYTHDIPNVFPEAALAEANAAKEATLKGREDWRDIPLITIDPADAKDHDDAVHAEADRDESNEGGFILHVAIADVAAYVLPGSALDREALNRGNSVYFPDRVVPMLPERISNELCSLKPGVNRAALGLRIIIDKTGKKLAHSFHRVLIRSAAKLAYQQAQAAIDFARKVDAGLHEAKSSSTETPVIGVRDEITAPLLEKVLHPLYAAYEALKIARAEREPLDLDLPERKLVLDKQGHVMDVTVPERLDAHKLIEEFMVLSNVCAAETLEKARIPLLYRIHDNPSIEKMQSLREFLETIGISLPKAGNVRPELFNRILARVKDGPNATLSNEVILRSQSQAEYSPDNIGHFGLNLRRYAHFTSPIRRYSDLIVHRGLIKGGLTKGMGAKSSGVTSGSREDLARGKKTAITEGALPETNPEQMREIGAQISTCERRAMAAERETTDRLIAMFLSERVGESFKGRIAGVTRAGLFVKLDRTGADGFIPAGTLGNDFFRHDEAAHALTGSRTGESYRLGDNVNVRLVEAQPMAGALRFEMLSEGRYVKVTRGKSRFKPLEERLGKGNTFNKPNASNPRGRNRRGFVEE